MEKEIGFNGDDFPRNRMSVRIKENGLTMMFTFDVNPNIGSGIGSRLMIYKAVKRFNLLKYKAEN